MENAMIRQGKMGSLYEMPLTIQWLPTLLCNYNCSYCSQNSIRPKGPDWLDLDKSIKIFDNLLKLNRDSYMLYIAGGEPTIYPHLADVIRHISKTYGDRLSKIALITNGALNKKLQNTILELPANISFDLDMSLHPERVKLEDIEHIIKTYSSVVNLSFELMFEPSMFDYVKQIFDYLCEMRLNFPFSMTILILREDGNGNIIDRRYRPEDFKWQLDAQEKFNKINNENPIARDIKIFYDEAVYYSRIDQDKYKFLPITNWLKAIEAGLYNFKDLYCCTGANFISIIPNGIASSTYCPLYQYTTKPVYEGSPYDDPEFCKIVKCNYECFCRLNDVLPKFSSKDEADDFMRHFRRKQARLTQQKIEKDNLTKEVERLKKRKKPLKNFRRKKSK